MNFIHNENCLLVLYKQLLIFFLTITIFNFKVIIISIG